MKKMNAKGFTLIELLAVITIMGILMIVAIPAITRTIENTRRDNFLDTAKQYANGVKTLWASDNLKCGEVFSSAVGAGDYYVTIDSEDNDILESGGKSSWGSRPINGFVYVKVTGEGTSRTVKYSVALRDTEGNGILAKDDDYLSLDRSDVKVGSYKDADDDFAAPAAEVATECSVQE